MALAVKNAPEVGSTSLVDRLGAVSLLGLVYVLGCLAIVLQLLPSLWFDVLRLPRTLSPSVILGVLMISVAGGLIYLGGQLLGPKAHPGARAGIFTAFIGFLVIVLLTRWASVWIEHWVYRSYLFGSAGPMVGAVLTGLVGMALAVVGVRWLFSKGAEKTIVAFEEQGWFTTTGYKPQQGQRVRRGTILGLLIIAVAGIWTLISHGTLKKGPANWELNYPFTAVVYVEDPGDVGDHLKDAPQERDPEAPATATPVPKLGRYQLRDVNDTYANPNKYVKVTYAGRAESLRDDVGKVIDRAKFDQAVAELEDEFNKRNAFVDEDKRAQLRAEFEKEDLPHKADPAPATGTTRFAHATLLPSVQYTLPLLLLAAAAWLAWRVVNLPPFADFLIATEAELNKVSWTTRKRLYQDTIVVLVTVVLMAGYLFTMDIVWKELLSWKPIGVLHLPEGKQDQNIDEREW